MATYNPDEKEGESSQINLKYEHHFLDKRIKSKVKSESRPTPDHVELFTVKVKMSFDCPICGFTWSTIYGQYAICFSLKKNKARDYTVNFHVRTYAFNCKACYDRGNMVEGELKVSSD